MRCSPAVVLAWTLTITPNPGCGERSRIVGGDHDAVRHQLPDEYVEILEHPDRLEVLSLDPRGAAGQDAFHGRATLGRAPVTSPHDRTVLVASIYRSILEGSGMAVCFIPRHGIRAVKGDRRIDLVICHQCWQMEVHGAGIHSLGPWAAPYRTVAISSATKPVINRLLERAGIELAPED